VCFGSWPRLRGCGQKKEKDEGVASGGGGERSAGMLQMQESRGRMKETLF